MRPQISRRRRRTYDIDIKTEIDGAVPDASTDLANDLIDTEIIYVVRRDDLEPDLRVVRKVCNALDTHNLAYQSLTRAKFARVAIPRRTVNLHRIPACTLDAFRISFSSCAR